MEDLQEEIHNLVDDGARLDEDQPERSQHALMVHAYCFLFATSLNLDPEISLVRFPVELATSFLGVSPVAYRLTKKTKLRPIHVSSSILP